MTKVAKSTLSTNTEQAPGAALKGKFLDAICDAVCDQLNVEGMAYQVAGLVAPKVLGAVTVDKIAEQVMSEFGDDLAEKLAAGVAKRLVAE